jgi:hypothetical protein
LATPAPSLEDLAAATIHDLGLQTQLPQPIQPLPSVSLPLPEILLWAAVAVLLALLLYSLRGFWPRARGVPGELETDAARAAQPDASHLDRADAFAAQGAFVEAMHELLLEALRQVAAGVADSFTSREILRSASLPARAQTALRAIVAQVELTWFGQHLATGADYRGCRADFDVLYASLRQAAPR